MYVKLATLILLHISEFLADAQDPRLPLLKNPTPFDTSKCTLSSALVTEIQSYQATADAIFNVATQKPFKGKTYSKLEYLADTFGPRRSGTPALEKVIDYALHDMKRQGLQNIQAEKVQVPRVHRGNVIGKMLKPRVQDLGLSATGFSAPTFGLVAFVFIIPSLEYFMANKEKVRGKIAVFDYLIYNLEQEEFMQAEEAGAAAVMSRSLVSFSIYSIAKRAGSPNLRIPAVFATNEDIDLFRRLNLQGFPIEVYLKVINSVKMTTSRNIMGVFPGKSKPNEYVMISGHLDSWFSEGAHDDGVGVALALQVPKLLKKLNLIPKRTVRSVLFTAEELGLYGSKSFVKTHAADLSRYNAIIEADGGCFKAGGWALPRMFTQFGCILNEILKLQLKTIGAKELRGTRNTLSEISTDIYSFSSLGVPGANLIGDDEQQRYFWYHHTLADTMSVVNSSQLDRCVALAATTVYILADLTNLVERN